MNQLEQSRRDFLRRALCWVALGAVSGCRALPGSAPAPGDISADWLGDVIGNLESAARFGSVYLDAHPGERDVHQLLEHIENVAQGRTDFEGVSAALRDDYVRGNTVMVDGWLLSRTEARLFALAALSSP